MESTKDAYGGTYMTSVRAITMKFKNYMKDPKQIMVYHLEVLSAI